MDKFLCRIVTVDKTWIHHNTPEIKQQSKQWVQSAPAGVVWDARDVIHIDSLQNGKTFNGEYYANLLGQFNENLKKINDHIWSRKKFFPTRTTQGSMN